MKILDRQGLKEKGINWHRGHIDRQEKKGLFPRHIELGQNTIGWVESEIDQYLLDCIAARDNPPVAPARKRGKHAKAEAAETPKVETPAKAAKSTKRPSASADSGKAV